MGLNFELNLKDCYDILFQFSRAERQIQETLILLTNTISSDRKNIQSTQTQSLATYPSQATAA